MTEQLLDQDADLRVMKQVDGKFWHYAVKGSSVIGVVYGRRAR